MRELLSILATLFALMFFTQFMITKSNPCSALYEGYREICTSDTQL